MGSNLSLRRLLEREINSLVPDAQGPRLELGWTTDESTGYFLLRLVHRFDPREQKPLSGSLFRFYPAGTVEFRNWHHLEGELRVRGEEENLQFSLPLIDPDTDEYCGELEEFIRQVDVFVREALRRSGIEVQ